MSDEETSRLSTQVANLSEQLAAFRDENRAINGTILKRLDGGLDENTGMLEGGICALVKGHERFIRNRQKWDWAIIVAFLGALAYAIACAVTQRITGVK